LGRCKFVDKEKVIQLIDENTYAIEGLIAQKVDIWAEHVLFSRLWWFGVGLSIIPWILWMIYRKKDSTARLLYAGFYIMVISLVLDVLGDQFAFWHYRFNVIPILPTFLPWDLTLMPITVMSLMQVKPDANPYLKALVFALITSYAAEPFFEWLDVYKIQKWSYSYSAPIQFLLYISAHYISRQKTFEPLS
jgi:hypothetical protein